MENGENGGSMPHCFRHTPRRLFNLPLRKNHKAVRRNFHRHTVPATPDALRLQHTRSRNHAVIFRERAFQISVNGEALAALALGIFDLPFQISPAAFATTYVHSPSALFKTRTGIAPLPLAAVLKTPVATTHKAREQTVSVVLRTRFVIAFHIGISRISLIGTLDILPKSKLLHLPVLFSLGLAFAIVLVKQSPITKSARTRIHAINYNSA